MSLIGFYYPFFYFFPFCIFSLKYIFNMSQNGWCTIESDPAVFTELLENIGVSGAVLQELISLDRDSIDQLGKVYGVILLFKWKKELYNRAGQHGDVTNDPSVYFARQIVNNACATQAILNTVLNFPQDLQLNEDLANFYSFTNELDPATRGEIIGQSEFIRAAHNSFARPATFSFEDNKKAKDDDDVFHFSSFIYKNGAILELDGLRDGPVRIRPATSEDWKDKMIETLQGRMQEIASADTTGHGQGISFSLMAVTEDRIGTLEEAVALAMSEEKPCDHIEAELQQLRAEREKGHHENVRRRHNYMPAIIELLKSLSEKGKLQGIVDATVKRAQERAEANKA